MLTYESDQARGSVFFIQILSGRSNEVMRWAAAAEPHGLGS